LLQGRGGFGNIRESSTTRCDDISKVDGPDDFSPARGREAKPQHVNGMFSTGRGGAGNLRSPSREPIGASGLTAEEQEVINRHKAEDKVVVSGRGGLGNISSSRSRSRGPATLVDVPEVHSTGRGGFGNVARKIGDDRIDEEERKSHAPLEGIHSTGRGGYSNMTSTPTPAVEHLVHLNDGGIRSTGRGGAGNMSRDRSADGRSKERQSGVSGLWQRVTGSKEHSASPPVHETERGREH